MIDAVTAGLTGVAATIDCGRLRVEYPTARYSARQVVAFLLERFDMVDITVPDADLESVLRRICAGAVSA